MSTVKALNVGRNETYRSPEIIAKFLDIMAASVKASVVNSVADCESFAFMCDESINVEVLKQLVMYVRICDKGTCRTHLSLLDIPDGTAETIVMALKDVLASCELSMDNVALPVWE